MSAPTVASIQRRFARVERARDKACNRELGAEAEYRANPTDANWSAFRRAEMIAKDAQRDFEMVSERCITQLRAIEDTRDHTSAGVRGWRE